MQKTVVDHIGRTITYSFPPQRIVSLCPSITDTLLALNLQEQLVGRTRFCIHPADQVRDIPAVAGTKDLKLEKLLARRPDLVIMEKEENTKEMVELLEQHVPVFVFEVQSIRDAYRMMTELGAVTDRLNEAHELVTTIQSRFAEMPALTSVCRVAYVIWRKPYMVVGRNTYIQSVLERLGLINPFVSYIDRYPTVTQEDFRNAQLDFVLLSSEPYPFKAKQQDEFRTWLPDVQPLLVDGEMFWYGPRMLHAASYLQNLIKRLQV